MPGKAQSLWEMVGLEGSVADTSLQSVEQPALGGRKIQRIEVLFPKPASV
jgi:methionyl-tRNA synthetase